MQVRFGLKMVWNAEIGNFWVPQQFFKKVTSAGLNSPTERVSDSSEKLDFVDPFHKKESVLVILLLGMIH